MNIVEIFHILRVCRHQVKFIRMIMNVLWFATGYCEVLKRLRETFLNCLNLDNSDSLARRIQRRCLFGQEVIQQVEIQQYKQFLCGVIGSSIDCWECCCQNLLTKSLISVFVCRPIQNHHLHIWRDLGWLSDCLRSTQSHHLYLHELQTLLLSGEDDG